MDAVALLRAIDLVAFVVLGIAALLVWRRRRVRPAAWIAVAFSSLALAIVISRIGGLIDSEGVSAWMTRITILLLVLFPYALLRFSAWGRRNQLVVLPAGVATAVVAVTGLFVIPFPEPVDRALAHNLWLVALLVLWTAETTVVAWRMLRAGREERLVRPRMLLIAWAAVALNVALLFAVAGTGRAWLTATTQILAVVSAVLFLLGYVAPRFLRAWWRRNASAAFRQAELAMLAAITPEEVAASITPLAAGLLGAGVLVADRNGRVLASDEIDPISAEAIAEALARGESPPDVVSVGLHPGWLAVRAGSYTPVFGADERDLLDGLAVQLRLALERAELFVRERESRREVEESRTELESIVAGLSHDLKTPVTTIVGFVDLLVGEEPVSDEERDHFTTVIRRNAELVRELVEDLLELSRVGKAEARREPVEVAKVVEEVRGALIRGTQATVVSAPSLPVLTFDPARARQLFDNLIGNALRHGGRPDITVSVSSYSESDGVVIVVEDDGVGIPRDDRERLFRLFERGATGEPGSGVGLTMCRRIVQTAGGALEITDSVTGMRLEISLPSEVVILPPQETRSPTNASG
ncbi:MAG: sensor histidine kinase [Nitriliruptorales bacterium]